MNDKEKIIFRRCCKLLSFIFLVAGGLALFKAGLPFIAGIFGLSFLGMAATFKVIGDEYYRTKEEEKNER